MRPVLVPLRWNCWTLRWNCEVYTTEIILHLNNSYKRQVSTQYLYHKLQYIGIIMKTRVPNLIDKNKESHIIFEYMCTKASYFPRLSLVSGE